MKKEMNYHPCSLFASVQVVLLAFLLLPTVAKAATLNNKYEAENSIVTDGEFFWGILNIQGVWASR